MPPWDGNGEPTMANGDGASSGSGAAGGGAAGGGPEVRAFASMVLCARRSFVLPFNRCVLMSRLWHHKGTSYCIELSLAIAL